MDRVKLTKDVLFESVRMASAVTRYTDRPRHYVSGEGETLYMREVHFLVEVGLDGQENPTMSEMARRLAVTQGAVTQTAVRLEKKGYILRLKDAGDKRLTTVSLTEKGRAACKEHIQFDHMQYQSASERLGEFSDRELLLFLRMARRVGEIFTKPEGEIY